MRLLLLAGFLSIAAPLALAQTTAPTSSPPVVEPTTQGTTDMGSAAETPLRNANLVRQSLPPVLVSATNDPYALPRPLNCATLDVEVVNLNGALGDDLDAGPSSGHRALAPEAVKVAANALIPWQGVVRFVSGADARDRKIRRAIIAGVTRRAYLKGLGEAKGCGLPAMPLGHPLPPPPARHPRPRPHSRRH
ncbi:MAG TPA: hypothetical protein VG166_13475 [Caulobacteraceae bacterium]|jgi:hypothetical protein|nr:hypothetical protein [Caulobacteraceae bacterium]